MSTGLLRKLSILTLVLAAALGLYAYKLGREITRPPEVASEEERLPRVVVATRSVEAGTPLAAEDVGLEPMGVAPKGSFATVDPVLERAPVITLEEGEPVLAKHFFSLGPLGESLLPGERAVAVKVDGVIGLGGFVQPGDRVDVLLYLARDGREVEASRARLLAANLRVLAYGDRTPSDGGEAGPVDARSAVLAMPAAQMSRLMLGASKGRLRLALRGSDESADLEGPEEVTLSELMGEQQPPAPARAAPAPARSIVVHRGARREEEGL